MGIIHIKVWSKGTVIYPGKEAKTVIKILLKSDISFPAIYQLDVAGLYPAQNGSKYRILVKLIFMRL